MCVCLTHREGGRKREREYVCARGHEHQTDRQTERVSQSPPRVQFGCRCGVWSMERLYLPLQLAVFAYDFRSQDKEQVKKQHSQEEEAYRHG